MKQENLQTPSFADLESKGIQFLLSFDRHGALCGPQISANWSWMIFSLTDTRARREIEKSPKLPQAARQPARRRQQIPAAF
jgi:hypothetical protein